MYVRKSNLLLLLLLATMLIHAQTKPIIKIDLQGGPGTKSGNFGLFIPTLYVPVQTHIDLGLSYNILKVTYTDHNSNTPFEGTVTYKFPSFYIRFNGSNNLKKVNPFIGYILSFVKGEHKVSNDRGDGGYNPYPQMSPADQTKLEEALSKSEIAHGIQGGIEFKIFSGMSFFIKAMALSFPGEKAFPFHYSSNTFSYNTQVYALIGLIFKFYGSTSNKKLIK